MFAMNKPGDRYLAHRRRAALAALAPHLTKDSLRDALWLFQKEFTAPGVPCLIAFVDAVSSRFGIGPIDRKQLYAELFRQLNAVDERDLPDDPWPLMNNKALIPGTGAFDSGNSATTRFGMSESRGNTAKKGAESIFVALVRNIHAGLNDRTPDEQNQFWASVEASIEQMTALGAKRSVVLRWLRSAGASSVTLGLNPEQMSAVVHAVYISLCLSVGRIDADAMIDAGATKVRYLPEAAEFPPERLLWT